MRKLQLPKRRTTPLFIIGAGLWMMLIGALFLINLDVAMVSAQDNQAPKYIGMSECRSCHRGDLTRLHEESPHARTLEKVNNDQSNLLATFAGSQTPVIQFPGEDQPRALTPDDIAYVVGAGRYVQRYLYDQDDTLMVLPFEWNAVEKTWQPYAAADNWPDPAYDWKNCAGCHTTGYNLERNRWEDEGVQCEACHGPGSDHVEAAEDAGRRPSDEEFREIRAAIVVSPDAQICGQCHSAGVSTTDNLPYPVGVLPGQSLKDGFTLSTPDDSAHWWASGHANHKNMQYNEWLQSSHATSLEALKGSDQARDKCLQCHSSDYRYTETLLAAHVAGDREGDAPEPITLDTAQFGVTCLTCHEQHQTEPTDMQLPAEPYTLCVQCHSDASPEWVHHPVQQMYEGQPIVANVDPVASTHFTDDNGPDCITCHMTRVPVDMGTRANHLFKPVLPGAAMNIEGLPDTCSACHSELVNQTQMQKLIDDVQNDTRKRLETDKAALGENTPDWVRVALTFVEGDGSLGIHNYAYTDALLDAVETELGLDQVGGK